MIVKDNRVFTLFQYATIDQCQQVGIEPGDEYRSFVADGHITIVKKTSDEAKGILKHVKGDSSVTDDASLRNFLR